MAHPGSLYTLYVLGCQGNCPGGDIEAPILQEEGVKAQFIKMGSMLCQIGNEMRMLTTATAEALKTFRDALS